MTRETDRELLEMAAKCLHNMRDPNFANYEVLDDCVCLELGNRRGAITSYWNPLTDDGDALRLAVKLKLTPMMRNLGVDVVSLETTEAAYERYRDDPCAATRRAIVRAAAEIGRSKT